jgi:hypothetical protein
MCAYFVQIFSPNKYNLNTSKSKLCVFVLYWQVRVDSKRGLIVVSKVADENLIDIMSVGDYVVAVNGAPLGYVTNAQILQQKISPLRRPIVITFSRSNAAVHNLDQPCSQTPEFRERGLGQNIRDPRHLSNEQVRLLEKQLNKYHSKPFHFYERITKYR